ncbi:hypothetical protein PIB30_073256, partial [Stylosanthes scabra]|nr:hypothetical protein [Stylosanthes scabra]
ILEPRAIKGDEQESRPPHHRPSSPPPTASPSPWSWCSQSSASPVASCLEYLAPRIDVDGERSVSAWPRQVSCQMATDGMHPPLLGTSSQLETTISRSLRRGPNRLPVQPQTSGQTW